MKTILLIEDNKDILENFTEYFELLGYKILAANNGKKGIELAIEFMPDLIICDFLMPNMDGQKVLEVLLNTNKTNEIPFIFSTSKSEKIDETHGLDLGADAYIVKPFELEKLLELAKTTMSAGNNKKSLSVSEAKTINSGRAAS